MITLINGRGQLGRRLSQMLKDVTHDEEDVYIYHTWNIDDKSETVQKKEYEKFLFFIEQHKRAKIIFVSTYSEKENWYNHYKQKSEAYLIDKCEKAIVIRLPTLIGKGTIVKLKNNEISPYGFLELLSLDAAAKSIINKVSYDGIIKNFIIRGETISADSIQQMLSIGEGN